jgi:hypothetical protein
MVGFLAFIPGHLLMVALHGWNTFASMSTGWKKAPDYLDDRRWNISPHEGPAPRSRRIDPSRDVDRHTDTWVRKSTFGIVDEP